MKDGRTARDKKYAYLSVDQTKGVVGQRRSVVKNQLFSVLNIQLDNRKSLRTPNCLLSSQDKYQKTNAISTISPVFSCQPREDKVSNFEFMPNPRKKRYLTETMLDSIAQSIGKKENLNKMRGQQGQKKIKKKKSLEPSALSANTSEQEMALEIFIGQRVVRAEGEKAKRPLFNEMLKKCARIKEIYRYENELTELKKQKDMNLYLGVNNEAFSLTQDDENSSNCLTMGSAKKRVFKKKYKLTLPEEGEDSFLARPQKTFDIRRYNNDSALMQRVKHMKQKELLIKEGQRLSKMMDQDKQGERTHDKYGQRHQSKMMKTQPNEVQIYGPWGESEARDVFSLK